MDVTFRDRAVRLGETLVVADLHLGKGAASAVEFPLGADADVVGRFEDLLERFDPAEVVLAGDVLHSFDYVPDGVAETVGSLTDAARDAGARPVMIEGNHDTMLGSVWSGRVHDEYRVDADGTDVLVCHGHEEPDGTAERYVIGHDHPMIEIEGRKRPCLLDGRGVYRESDVLVVPPFNRLVEGVSVNGRIGAARPHLSPLVTRVAQFRPLVYDETADETLEFPPLGQFDRML
jgi:metallophosphoesterase superfamily enzyme